MFALGSDACRGCNRHWNSSLTCWRGLTWEIVRWRIPASSAAPRPGIRVSAAMPAISRGPRRFAQRSFVSREASAECAASRMLCAVPGPVAGPVWTCYEAQAIPRRPAGAAARPSVRRAATTTRDLTAQGPATWRTAISALGLSRNGWPGGSRERSRERCPSGVPTGVYDKP